MNDSKGYLLYLRQPDGGWKFVGWYESVQTVGDQLLKAAVEEGVALSFGGSMVGDEIVFKAGNLEYMLCPCQENRGSGIL